MKVKNVDQSTGTLMNSQTGLWLIRKLQGSGKSLLKKIGYSLDRDKELSMMHLLRKSLVYILSMATGPFNLMRCNKIGKYPRTRRRPYIENAGRIIIGNDVNINSKNVQTDFVTGHNGLIEIGNDVSINFGVSLVAENWIKLGDRIRLGPYVMIQDTDRHIPGERHKWAEGEPVLIEDDVWLASRVIVLKGAHIGRGSVIAAGSVVTGFIPPYVVAAGMPAKVVRYLKAPEDAINHKRELNSDLHGLNKAVYRRTVKIFRKHFPHINEKIAESVYSFTSIDEWDSTSHMIFIHALEEEFEITFQKADMTRLSNMEKISRLIQKKHDQSELQSKIAGASVYD